MGHAAIESEPMTTVDNTHLSFIVDGYTYPFWDGATLFTSTDGETKIYYIADNGLGMPPVVRYTQRGPQQHGDSDVDFRMEPRIVPYVFGIHAPSLADLETARDLLMWLFRPTNIPFTVQYERSNGSTRQLLAHFNAGMQFASTDRDQGTWFQRFNVDIRAADPTFFDPFEETASFINTYASSGGFIVPVVIPFSIRGDNLGLAKDIYYQGTADVLPVVKIFGPVVSPVLTNATTGAVLSFPDITISGDGYYTIDLRTGYKTVLDQDGVDRTFELTDTSSLDVWNFTVQRLPHHVTFSASYVGVQPEVVRITWNNRYLGV